MIKRNDMGSQSNWTGFMFMQFDAMLLYYPWDIFVKAQQAPCVTPTHIEQKPYGLCAIAYKHGVVLCFVAVNISNLSNLTWRSSHIRQSSFCEAIHSSATPNVLGPFYSHGLILISTRISNNRVDGCTVEVLEIICNFSPKLTMDVST